MKGIIYKIESADSNVLLYIGSTTQELRKRFVEHMKPTSVNNRKNEWSNFLKTLSKEDRYKLIPTVIEDIVFDDEKELRKREGECIRDLKPKFNIRIEGRDMKQWYKDNKEQIKQQRKQYREENHEEILKRKKDYRERSKEKIRLAGILYRKANEEALKERKRQYREVNKQRINEKKRQYHEANKERINEKKRQYRAKKKQTKNQTSESIAMEIIDDILNNL